MKENEIKVGWYAFEGGNFSPNPNAYPNCQGVVAYLSPDPYAPIGQRGLILTPDEIQLPWADEYCETESNDYEDGKSNTAKLIAYGKKNYIDFPAAEWCYSYSKNGVKPGEGFLPAKGQLRSIVTHQNTINPALEKIGGVILRGWILSSTEHLSDSVWGMSVYRGRSDLDYKYRRNCCVRCVIAF